MTPAEQHGKAPSSPELRPPVAAQSTASGAGGQFRRWWVALAIIVVLLLAVVLVLPRMVPDPAAAPATANINREAVTQPAPAEVSADRREAEQTLQRYLKARARLGLANAMQWGEAEMNAAANLATEGDRSFGQREFAMAAGSYAGALQSLEQLESESETRLATALELGTLALDMNDSTLARQHFEMALAIEPDNQAAQTGLARAQVRPQVLQLIQTGHQAEVAGDFSTALSALDTAVQLDAAYLPAVDALQRVAEAARQRDFRAAMSRALVALDEGRFAAARTALDAAERLKPGEAVVLDTRQQLHLARQKSQLISLRQQVREAISNEDWRTAAGLYLKVLAIAPNAGFARDGLARAQDRLRLHQQMDKYLDDPARLYSKKPLASAEQLLVSAGKPPPAETRLRQKVERLQELVATAQTPLPVTLYSDGLTSVAIYHVGRLGKFTSKQLELRPGTYTVVGSRAGYRDVRHTLTVLPGQQQTVLEVRSGEAV